MDPRPRSKWPWMWLLLASGINVIHIVQNTNNLRPILLPDEIPTVHNKALPPPTRPKMPFEPVNTSPEECQTPPETFDPFPSNFEPSIYDQKNRGSVSANTILDQAHYDLVGKYQGWTCTRGQDIRQYINEVVLALALPSLEIGPFTKPQLQGPKVKYFDVLDKDGLIERATRINYPVQNPVTIDFVDASGDLNSIEQSSQFAMVFSSHCIEHQLDLVRHLQAVSRILVDGGYYMVLVPDKRFCFDHFLPPTTMAQVLDDFYHQRYFETSHKVRSVLEHRAHTQGGNYWADVLPTRPEANQADFVNRIRGAIQEFETAALTGAYVDVHNYYFTPSSLSEIVQFLNDLKLINLSVHRVYHTVKGSVEFGIVLKNSKCMAVAGSVQET